jgi:hypothetical protein
MAYWGGTAEKPFVPLQIFRLQGEGLFFCPETSKVSLSIDHENHQTKYTGGITYDKVLE